MMLCHLITSWIILISTVVRVATLYVYDDDGTLDRVNVASDDSLQQVAKDLIDHVIDWTNIHGGAIYPVRDCQAHMDELMQLKQAVTDGMIDASKPEWFESVLGFTFSIEAEDAEISLCGKYPEEEVLPDETEHCSLCGSEMDASGACLYVNKK